MKANIVICGAGIAGISAAYHLAVKQGIENIVLLDERPPLSLTSDKSTECYRNWWPDPSMVALMNHSIELMDELARKTRNLFQLNRRGYLYVTCDPQNIPLMLNQSVMISKTGGGEFRQYVDRGSSSIYFPILKDELLDLVDGADFISDKNLIKHFFPYLTQQAEAVLHVRRAGWLSAHQLGSYLLEQARLHGVRLYQTRVDDLVIANNRIKTVKLSDGQDIETDFFINAAGPMMRDIGNWAGVEIPVVHELHQKCSFRDSAGIIPRQAPLIISMDPIQIPWSVEERSLLMEENKANEFLFHELPAGAHIRPEGGSESQTVLMLWDFQTEIIEPIFPPPQNEIQPDLTMRALSQLIPGLKQYVYRRGRVIIDGGYYTRTPENRPLIGPTPVRGVYLIGALSGFGIMAACAAGDLLARIICEQEPPPYASDFMLSRYDDPSYLEMVKTWGDTGQL